MGHSSARKDALSRGLTDRVRGAACIGLLAFALSSTEPAAFLDTRWSLVLLSAMPPACRGEVAKIVLPSGVPDTHVASLIWTLKQRGVQGVLLMGLDRRIYESPEVRQALELENVVWVADPLRVEHPLQSPAVCHPLLVCTEFGSAVLAEEGAKNECSATTLALACVGDVELQQQIASLAFKLRFRNAPYVHQINTNTRVACVTEDDTRSSVRYATPSGLKTPPEYAIDVCQALLDRRYLIQAHRPRWRALTVFCAMVFGSIQKEVQRFAILAVIITSLSGWALVSRMHVPAGTVMLSWAVAVALSPVLRQHTGHAA